LALWEIGTKHLRIPVADVVDTERAKRLHDLYRLGFRFSLYSFDQPSSQLIDTVLRHAKIFDSWELGFRFSQLTELNFQALTSCQNQGIEIYASPLRSKEEIVASGKKYYHVINHGFTVSDNFSETQETMFQQLLEHSGFNGIVLRCSLDDDISQVINIAEQLETRNNIKSIMHLRMTADNPAEAQVDTTRYCNRLAEAMFRRWDSNSGKIFCDSFVDIDRGYFPRTGLLDRRFNPNPGFYVTKSLHQLFNVYGKPAYLNTHSPDTIIQILSAKTATTNITLFLNWKNRIPKTYFKKGEWLNWYTGKIESSIEQFSTALPVIHIEDISRA